MKEIYTSNNNKILVDDSNYAELIKYKWRLGSGYAVTGQVRNETYWKMHHYVLPKDEVLDIDHIDGNKLNNQKLNLRYITRAQNKVNSKKHVNNVSGFRGVCLHKATRKWEAQGSINSQRVYIGLYPTKELAAKAYNDFMIVRHGKYAQLNQI